MRSIYELSTEEAYHLAAEHFGHDLPPLDAVENEDWGRDYVLPDDAKDGADDEENPYVPAGYTYFGQFVDHDLTFDTISNFKYRRPPPENQCPAEDRLMGS